MNTDYQDIKYKRLDSLVSEIAGFTCLSFIISGA